MITVKSLRTCSKLLAKEKLTIAFAESATAGRMAAEFASMPESGKTLKGGIVCYDVCVKEAILKVPYKLIKKFTPESAEVTKELAKNLRKIIEADVYVAVTGLTRAGGSETREKPVGSMFIHILWGEKSIGITKVFKGTPKKIILQTIYHAAALIEHMLRV